MSDDLRALSDAATPGPWRAEPGSSGLRQDGTHWPARWISFGAARIGPMPEAIAAYVVALVNAHRESQQQDTTEWERMRAENARLRAQSGHVEAGPWSCTTDHAVHPGCGRCLMCRRALAAGWVALAGDDRLRARMTAAVQMVHDSGDATPAAVRQLLAVLAGEDQ